MPRYNPSPPPTGNLFESPPESRRAVILGGHRPDWYAFAEGYRVAANLLVDRLRSLGVVAEHVCLPILFLYRHFIELSLKALLLDLGELTDAPELTSDRHLLQPLWTKFRDRLRAANLEAGSVPWLDRIGGWIAEFDRLDSRSYTFRYPVDPRGNAHLRPGQAVDIERVRHIMGEVAGAFAGAGAMIDEHLDLKRELRDEADFGYYYS